MLPQTQRTKTDCLRTAIACLLDMNAADVPDFSLSLNWWQDMQEWLHERGLFFLEVRISGLIRFSADSESEIVNTVWNPLPFPALAILAGPLASGVRHMIIGTCQDSDFTPQFDPATGGDGENTINVQSVCFLVPRDPGTYAKFGRNMEKIETLSKSLIKGAKPNAINHEIHEIARESLGSRSGILRCF